MHENHYDDDDHHHLKKKFSFSSIHIENRKEKIYFFFVLKPSYFAFIVKNKVTDRLCVEFHQKQKTNKNF